MKFAGTSRLHRLDQLPAVAREALDGGRKELTDIAGPATAAIQARTGEHLLAQNARPTPVILKEWDRGPKLRIAPVPPPDASALNAARESRAELTARLRAARDRVLAAVKAAAPSAEKELLDRVQGYLDLVINDCLSSLSIGAELRRAKDVYESLSETVDSQTSRTFASAHATAFLLASPGSSGPEAQQELQRLEGIEASTSRSVWELLREQASSK